MVYKKKRCQAKNWAQTGNGLLFQMKAKRNRKSVKNFVFVLDKSTINRLSWALH
jgi:hypothetical protein